MDYGLCSWHTLLCVCVLVAESWPTLCDPMDYSLPGSSVHGSLQARILEWVAIHFSRGLPDPRIKFGSSCTAGTFFTVWDTREAHGQCPWDTFLNVSQSVSQSIQSLSCVQLFATPGTSGHQASLSITNSQSLLKLMSIEPVIPSNHLILCWPLLLPPSIFPSIRVFSYESVLPIRWPKYWRLLKVPWTARRSNQSILKEIRPKYSLEGLITEAETSILGLPDVKM